MSENAVYLDGRLKSTFSVIISGYEWTGPLAIPGRDISRRMNWFLHRVQFGINDA